MREVTTYILVILGSLGLIYVYNEYLPYFLDSFQSAGILEFANKLATKESLSERPGFILYPLLLYFVSSLSGFSLHVSGLILNALLYLITFFSFKSIFRKRFDLIAIIFISVPVIQLFGSISNLTLLLASLSLFLAGVINYFRRGRLIWLFLIFLGGFSALLTSLVGITVIFSLVIYYILFRHADKRPEVTFIGLILILLLIPYISYIVFNYLTSGFNISIGNESILTGFTLIITSIANEFNFMVDNRFWPGYVFWVSLILQLIFFVWYTLKYWPHFNLAFTETRSRFTMVLIITGSITILILNVFIIRAEYLFYALMPVVLFLFAMHISALSYKVSKTGLAVLRAGLITIVLSGHLLSLIHYLVNG